MIDLERIVPLEPEGTATPLFCVHSSSGSAYSYLGLAKLLDPDRPVYGIEAPGFDDDREPIRSVPLLSAEYAATLRAFRPHGDVALLGWSLGGVIAFDMAQRLTAAGTGVRLVILVDASVPAVTEVPSERDIARRFLREMTASMGTPSAMLDQLLAELPEDAGSEASFLAAERSGALPAGLDRKLLAERYPVFRAHLQASYTFEVTEPYHGPVVHLIASESLISSQMHWTGLATDLTEHTVPGSHHSIWTGDGLPRLAELARAALADVG